MICFWICSTYYLMLAFHIWIEKSKYRSPLPYYHWNLSISRPDRIMNRLAMNFMMKISKHRRQHAAHRRFVLKFTLLPLPLTCLNTFTNLSIDIFRIYFPQNVSWSTVIGKKSDEPRPLQNITTAPPLYGDSGVTSTYVISRHFVTQLFHGASFSL